LGQFRETIRIEPSFPPACGSQSQIILCDGSLFSSASHQLQRVIVNFSDGPKLVNLIRIGLASLSRVDVDSARAGVGALLCDPKNHRISRFEVVSHLIPPAPNRQENRTPQHHNTIGATS
jgi:hypothetical protein